MFNKEVRARKVCGENPKTQDRYLICIKNFVWRSPSHCTLWPTRNWVAKCSLSGEWLVAIIHLMWEYQLNRHTAKLLHIGAWTLRHSLHTQDAKYFIFRIPHIVNSQEVPDKPNNVCYTGLVRWIQQKDGWYVQVDQTSASTSSRK